MSYAFRRCLSLVALLLLPMLALPWPAAAGGGSGLVLEAAAGRVEAWPALQVADEGPHALGPQQALALPFRPPGGPQATLGLRPQAVWLRLPLRAAPAVADADAAGDWVLDIAYPPLQQLDVYLLDADGRLLQQAALGGRLPVAERPLLSRTHALALRLPPGRDSTLLLRVRSEGALILPITLARPAEFHRHAQRELLLQGLLNGLGLALLAYSLIKGLVLRESFFAKYALMISGSLLFSLLQFGLGAQYLWPGSPWMERHAGGFAALLAACGSFLFIEQVLRPGGRAFARLMQGGALLCAALLPVYALDLLDTRAITALISVLGLAPAALGLPGALRLTRRRDPVGPTLLLAWAVYLATTALTIALIKGQVGADFWTLHAFQFGATFDMLMFMRVLSLRQAALQAGARQAEQERDLLRRLAHSDPLTGLANRRGLQQAFDAAIAGCSEQRPLALFLLDLNGFKQVNDRHGHEVGDALLQAVAGRLQGKLPKGDLLARLGGDEFVVISPGLRQPGDARLVGERLLEAFALPFQVQDLALEIGVALGQALAPQDGRELAALLRLADAAMYRGKPGGPAPTRIAPPPGGGGSARRPR